MSLAQLASSDQAELLLSPLSVCLDGVPMIATGRGLCFEHVSRLGSVLTPVQRMRQCSTIITESIYIFSLYHLRDTPTDPGVQYRGPTTRNRPGVGGRESRAFVGVSVAGKGLKP